MENITLNLTEFICHDPGGKQAVWEPEYEISLYDWAHCWGTRVQPKYNATGILSEKKRHSWENLISSQLPRRTALVEDGQGVLHSCCHCQTFQEHVSLCEQQTWLAGHVRRSARQLCLSPSRMWGRRQGWEEERRVTLIHGCVNGIFSF